MLLSGFPAELLKIIASELDDKDLFAFYLVSTRFHDVIYNDQVVWRERFLRSYEEPRNAGPGGEVVGYDWRGVYQRRKRLLERDLKKHTFTAKESELEVLLDMVLDSKPVRETPHSLPNSRNLQQLVGLPIFPAPSVKQAPGIVSTLRLLLSPLRQKSLSIPTFTLSTLQNIVYNPRAFPIFPDKCNPDAPDTWVLESIAAFLHYHIDPESESNVFHQKSLLKSWEFPAMWEGRLNVEGEGFWDDHGGEWNEGMESKWFGAYTYPRWPIQTTFLDTPPSVTDASDSHLMELNLTFSPHSHSSSSSSASASASSTSSELQTFIGKGKDYHAFSIPWGNLQPLHHPPSCCPKSSKTPTLGWSRVTFAKDYQSHRWLYEGVMLPGRNMILGRWRHLPESLYSGKDIFGGPFVLWRVPEDTGGLGGRDNRIAVRAVVMEGTFPVVFW